MFQTKVVEKIKRHFMFRSILSNIMPFSWQARDDNMACVDCVMDTEGYKHTHRICNTNYCHTATTVPWMHLSVTLHTQCVYY